MLAGLLFANDEADDRPDTLAATLSFGGATLIEYQARLLLAAGAAQIIIAVTRATPELVGAINRIRRGGLPVDIVRTAAEALEKTHPLATVLMLADGLIATEATVGMMAAGDGDALLVVDDAEALPGLERLDAATLWGGIARISPRRLAEAARLPDEYDLQSTLLRVVAQGQPARIAVTPSAVRDGHGIERDSRHLAQRGRRALGARLAMRRPWVDRFILAPIARLLLPPLVDRSVPSMAPIAVGGVLAVIGAILIGIRWPVTGLVFDCLAVIGFGLAQGLSWLRGEDRQARWLDAAISATVAIGVILLGFTVSRDAGTATGWFAAAALLVSGALLERAAPAKTRHRWWGNPPAYLLILTIAAIAGEPLAGLIAASAYAAASLAEAIEKLRQQP